MLLGNGDGTFKAAVAYSTGWLRSPSSVVIADFDRDGKLVVLTGSFRTGDVSFLRGNGDGTLVAASLQQGGFYIAALTAADFDNDGRLDLAAATGTFSARPDEIGVYYGRGDGTFDFTVPITIFVTSFKNVSNSKPLNSFPWAPWGGVGRGGQGVFAYGRSRLARWRRFHRVYPAFREDPQAVMPLHPLVRERFDETTRLGAFELPLLPDSASRVIAATRRDDVHARTLADLIRRDAALTGHVLRVAGSALFLGSPLVSFQQAISRLGMSAIREIALLVAFQTRVFRVEGHESLVRGMFRHALAAAVCAEEIARLRRWNLEEAFLTGLLHDVGRPVLLQLLVDIARANEVILDAEPALEAILPRHADVGAAIVLRFGLPETIADAVRNHHQPTGGPPQGAPLAALADRLAHVILDEEDPTPLEEDPLLGLVNLYPEDLAALLARKDHVLAAVSSLS